MCPVCPVETNFGLRIFLPALPSSVTAICLSSGLSDFPISKRDKAGSCRGCGWQFDILYLGSHNSLVDHCKLHTAGLTAKSQLAIVFLLVARLSSAGRSYQHLISYCLSVSQISPDDCSHRKSVHQEVPRPGDAGKEFQDWFVSSQRGWKLRGIFTFLGVMYVVSSSFEKKKNVVFAQRLMNIPSCELKCKNSV